jgi:hypothetical protein
MKLTRTYLQHRDVTAFGRALLAARDLDPVYEAFGCAGFTRAERSALVLAYSWFYHAGVAADIAEQPDFWRAARLAYEANAPRGTERRHFRGPRGLAAIEWVRARFATPEAALDALLAPTFGAFRARALAWPQTGDWMAFKLGDLLERVRGDRISFDDCALAFYREPRRAALLVAEERGLTAGVDALARLIVAEFDGVAAPPHADRPCGLQEIETMLCKYKAHRHGFYPVGRDRAEIVAALRARPVMGAGAFRARMLEVLA